MNFRIFMILALSNMIWSANPLFLKWILEDYPPEHASLFRYGTGLVSFLLVYPFLAKNFKNFPPLGQIVKWDKQIPLLFMTGAITFCLGAFLHIYGLNFTKATSSAIIVSFEPLAVALLAWLVLKQKPTQSVFLGFGIAILGFCFLSKITFGSLLGLFRGHSAELFGNLLILISLGGEAAYSSFGQILLNRRVHPVRVFFYSLFFGVLLTLVLSLLFKGIPEFSKMTLKTGMAMLWTGFWGTTGGYLTWILLMDRQIPLPSLALTLFLQPFCGAIWGFVFLKERLDPIQVGGALLILTGVLAQLVPYKKEVAPS